MSQFYNKQLIQRVTAYDVDEELTVTGLEKAQICICCLSKDAPFVSLSECKHAVFLKNCYNYKHEYADSLACRTCHNDLKRIDSFKQQVLKSFCLLKEQLRHLKPNPRSRKLGLSKTEITSNISYKFDIKLEPLLLTNEEQETRTNHNAADTSTNHEADIFTNQESLDVQDDYDDTTFKAEETNCDVDASDFETDLPLSVLLENKKKIIIKEKRVDKENKVKLSKVKKKTKKRKKLTRYKEKLEAKKKQPINSNYKGKICIKYLTLEEVMSERDSDRKKASYGKLPLKCDTCIVGFDHEIPYLDHMAKKHTLKEGSIQCDICKSVLNTEPSYNEHYKRHFRRYECEACGRRNNTLMAVVQHYGEAHGTIGEEFKCPDCDYTTRLHRQYRYHRDKHRGGARCVQCLKDFVNGAGLRLHMYTVHAHSSRVFNCETCDKFYRSKSGLSAHLSATGHGAPAGTAAATPAGAAPDAYCEPCRKYFRTRNGLRAHLQTHSMHVSDSDMRYVCDECGQKFLRKTGLQQHINWTHLNKIHYTCTKCSKPFKNKQALKKHKDFVHDKKRPPRDHVCDHCGRGFTTSSILQSHIRTHTGERPLQCKHCTSTFGHSAALYTHNKLVHGGGAR